MGPCQGFGKQTVIYFNIFIIVKEKCSQMKTYLPGLLDDTKTVSDEKDVGLLESFQLTWWHFLAGTV